MLITKSVEIKATGTLINKYKCKNHEMILIPIEELSIGSHALVQCLCDYCGKVRTIEYRQYQKQILTINKFSCRNSSCVGQKLKDIHLFVYGVESTFQLESTKNKIKMTNLEKYGVENPFQSDEIKKKIKKDNLEKHGVEHTSQLESVKNKSKITNLEKYGVENPFQSEEIKEKIKETNLERYGVEYPSQCQEIKDKIIESNLVIYGVSYSQTLDITKNKVRETNLERYGVEYPSQLESIKNKIKETNLDRHGNEYPSKLEWVKKKVRETNLDKFGSEHYLQSEVYKKSKSENGSYGYKEHNGYNYQSKYELDFLKFCETNSITLNKGIPNIKYILNDMHHTYYPDFYYDKYNLVIEIKSTYWYNYLSDMNQEKQKQTKLDGYNYILIMDKNYDEFIEKYLN